MRQVLAGKNLGSFIAAVFGLIYAVVNSGPLPTAVEVPLRVLGGLAFVAVLVAIRRSGTQSAADTQRDGRLFGRSYLLVVAAEVAALVAGLVVLNGPLDAPQAGVAWVSFVVGLHFFALGVLFVQPFCHWLAAAITVCGAAGLVMAALGATIAPISVVSGVVPGALLLAAGLWGASRRADTGDERLARPTAVSPEV